MVLDVIGGDYVARNLTACRVGGAIVQVGVMGGGTRRGAGRRAADPSRSAGSARCCGPRPLEEKIAVTPALRARPGAAVRVGVLRPVIDRSFPLEQVAGAHEHVASNANVGKVLLTL